MPKTAVNREQIVEAALDIADADGLDALTMRRLGDAIGTSPMATYKYVADKAELLEAMVDTALAPVPEPNPDEPWEDQLRGFFHAWYAALLEHPSAGHVMISRRLAAPETLRRGERAVAALVAAGMTKRRAETAFLALASFVVGAALVGAVRPGSELGAFDAGLEHLLTGFAGEMS